MNSANKRTLFDAYLMVDWSLEAASIASGSSPVILPEIRVMGSRTSLVLVGLAVASAVADAQ